MFVAEGRGDQRQLQHPKGGAGEIGWSRDGSWMDLYKGVTGREEGTGKLYADQRDVRGASELSEAIDHRANLEAFPANQYSLITILDLRP